MKKNYYILASILAIIVLVVIIGFVKNNNSQPEFLAEYSKKIVYTLDISLPTSDFENDCVLRNGIFNECGSPCEDEEEICASVCAFTCELR